MRDAGGVRCMLVDSKTHLNWSSHVLKVVSYLPCRLQLHYVFSACYAPAYFLRLVTTQDAALSITAGCSHNIRTKRHLRHLGMMCRTRTECWDCCYCLKLLHCHMQPRSPCCCCHLLPHAATPPRAPLLSLRVVVL
jgi:hypothetical protein